MKIVYNIHTNGRVRLFLDNDSHNINTIYNTTFQNNKNFYDFWSSLTLLRRRIKNNEIT